MNKDVKNLLYELEDYSKDGTNGLFPPKEDVKELLNYISDLLHQLEERNIVIDEAIDYIKNKYYEKNTRQLGDINLYVTNDDLLKVLGILIGWS